jgi:hypothetical protein
MEGSMNIEDDFLWIAGNAFSEMRLMVEGAITIFEDDTSDLLRLARDTEQYDNAVSILCNIIIPKVEAAHKTNSVQQNDGMGHEGGSERLTQTDTSLLAAGGSSKCKSGDILRLVSIARASKSLAFFVLKSRNGIVVKVQSSTEPMATDVCHGGRGEGDRPA